MRSATRIGNALVFGSSVAHAAGVCPNSVTYAGQGVIADGYGGYDLVTELCAVTDAAGNIISDAYGQTADAKGPYLLWVLTATGSKNADITGP